MSPPHNASDLSPDHWMIRLFPAWASPWLKLARVDRPIGTWLLLLPCWAGLLLALNTGATPEQGLLKEALWSGGLFAIGAFVMRAAGCVINDMADRRYDRQVARTATRPLASGELSMTQAGLFLVGLLAVGFLVLIQFNRFTILLALSSVVLVVIYPFMKRLTDWPQAWLGLTFNWGVLVGWASVTGAVALPAFVFYGGCLFWTLGYDTIYAHQDKGDDLRVGVRSSALRLGTMTKPALMIFYALAASLWTGAGVLAGASVVFFLSLVCVCAHFSWQIYKLEIDHPTCCRTLFVANCTVGFLLCLGLGAGLFWS